MEMEKEREEEEEGATLTLTLFDFYWFHNLILSKVPPPPLPIVSSQHHHRHNRSLSDDVFPSLPMLQVRTNLSSKESDDVVATAEARVLTRKSRGKSSKSLSDLEFEELKGFMDLGFTFAEVDVDARLMSIVPGLQRLKATESTVSADSTSSNPEEAPSRPYLSEAWDETEEDPLRNWRIPVTGKGIDIKNHLRFWAQTVASTVR